MTDTLDTTPTTNGAGATATPEAGDVPNSVLGVGFDPDELEHQDALEELAEAEATTAPPGTTDPEDIPLPGEEQQAGSAPALPTWVKIARTFAFAFVGTFLTALLPILNGLASGSHVDYSVTASLLVGAAAGALTAGIRTVVALLPVFPDDNDVGLKRRPAGS
jgi:hypothetical protein